MAAKQVREILVKVDSRGSEELKKISSQLGTLNRQTLAVSKAAKSFNAAFTGFLSFEILRRVTSAADSFQLINDRIKLFANTTEEASKTFNLLVEGARFTKTSFTELGTVYARLATATKDLGVSSEQAAALAIALQQTFRLSGSGAEEARAASVQLAQALGSGRLSGDELRSVLEQNAVFSRLLAKELGVTVGQLKNLGKEGKITAETVVNALSKSFSEVTKQTGLLGQTIGQSLTIALDLLTVKIGEVANDLGVNSAIAKGVEFLIDNFERLAIVLGALVAGGVIAKLITSLKNLAQAGGVVALVIGNWPVILGVAVGAVIAFRKELGILAQEGIMKLYELKIAFLELVETVLKKASFDGGIAKALGLDRSTKNASDSVRLSIEETKIEMGKYAENLAKVKKEYDKGGKSQSDFESTISKLLKTTNVSVAAEEKKAKKLKEGQAELMELNKLYREGTIYISEYNQALDIQKVEQTNKKFDEGRITLDQYLATLSKIPGALDKSTAAAFGAQKALKDYASSALDFAGNIGTAVGNLFSNLENSLVEFVRRGKLNFRDLTNAILDDLARIAVRTSITGPLAQAFASSFGNFSFGGGAAGGGGASARSAIPVTPSANGNVFSGGNIMKFASGGVVTGPTMFPMRSGAGLMGESGPEAIMPLTRRGGKLGVEGSSAPVYVNIINNSGNDVETKETTGSGGERQLEVIINSAVKKGIASGSYDRAFGESYGLNRRGR